MTGFELRFTVPAHQDPRAFDQHRVLVLNANGEPLGGFPVKTLTAADALMGLMTGRVQAVLDSSIYARSERLEIRVPEVVMCTQFVPQNNPYSDAPETLPNLFVRDQRRCVYTNRPLELKHTQDSHRASVDHVHPKSKEGADTWENWALAAARMNTDKTDRVLKKVAKRMRIRPWIPTFADLLYLHLRDGRGGIKDCWRDFLVRRPSDQVLEVLEQDKCWQRLKGAA